VLVDLIVDIMIKCGGIKSVNLLVKMIKIQKINAIFVVGQINNFLVEYLEVVKTDNGKPKLGL